jgi:hypothetical protein
VKDSTGEDERKGVEVTSTHEEELPGSRGSANFALRWHKDSKMPAHLNVREIQKEAKTKAKDILRAAYTAEDEGKWIGIVGFECRGMEVTDWQPQVSRQLTAERCNSRASRPHVDLASSLPNAPLYDVSKTPFSIPAFLTPGRLITGVLFMIKGKGQAGKLLGESKGVLSCI